mgnify:FL=1
MADYLSMLDIKSKFHENKDWNDYLYQKADMQFLIKSKFHENKDWNAPLAILFIKSLLAIKSKFHENKDWNRKETNLEMFLHLTSRASSTKTRIETGEQDCKHDSTWIRHQEQVPRKQGLKR